MVKTNKRQPGLHLKETNLSLRFESSGDWRTGSRINEGKTEPLKKIGIISNYWGRNGTKA